MKEKDHAHLSRTVSDRLPLFQPILNCILSDRNKFGRHMREVTITA